MQTDWKITPQVRRRYILGRQGLWPGRRWHGKEGTAEAIRTMESLQVDPVSVLFPSADIVLWGRVTDYQPKFLDTLLYSDRQFFDYGGHLDIYPIEELPYMRLLMANARSSQRWHDFQKEHPETANYVRRQLRERGPLCNRDLEGKSVDYYRAGKNTGVALYYLWLTGELMTHHRNRIERYHDFLENIAPPDLQWVAGVGESVDHLIRKSIRHLGMFKVADFRWVLYGIHGHPITSVESRKILDSMTTESQLMRIQVEGMKDFYYFPAEDQDLMQDLIRGEIPESWQPLATTTTDEVVFLSPLEMVSARGRAKELFDFEYIWEIYTPEPKRKYGPYVLPILYRDELVARVDSRLDRKTKTLVINGIWFEKWFQVDSAFVNAFSNGIKNFVGFLGADQVDANAMKTKDLSQSMMSTLSSFS